MELPITVEKITFDKRETLEKPMFGKCGDFVKIRPCGEQYGDKTYLGIMLGDMALSQSVRLDEKSGELKISRAMHNPAMFVPDLNEVIYGCGSWWGRIKSEDDLKKITDADIDDVWYVKALRELAVDEEE